MMRDWESVCGLVTATSSINHDLGKDWMAWCAERLFVDKTLALIYYSNAVQFILMFFGDESLTWVNFAPIIPHVVWRHSWKAANKKHLLTEVVVLALDSGVKHHLSVSLNHGIGTCAFSQHYLDSRSFWIKPFNTVGMKCYMFYSLDVFLVCRGPVCFCKSCFNLLSFASDVLECFKEPGIHKEKPWKQAVILTSYHFVFHE